MTRRWWGGSGISLVLHAGLLTILIWAAARPSRVDATATPASLRTKLIYTVGPGGPKPGGGGPDTVMPRMAPPRPTQPLDVTAPAAITRVEPIPVAAMPSITTQAVDILPGASLPVDGTSVGQGSGPGTGIGRGPGSGSTDGSGPGDVYDSGIGGVSEPRLIHEVKPNFTVDAMRAKVQGVVLMDVVVLADGRVDPSRIRITRSLERGLDQEAVIAVRQWRFRPSLRLGQPVASRVTVEIAFTLR